MNLDDNQCWRQLYINFFKKNNKSSLVIKESDDWQKEYFRVRDFACWDKINPGMTHIDLSFLSIDKFPKELCSIPELTHINLAHNNMCDVPKEIEQLKNLKVLDLSYNKITNVPDKINNLSNLEVLDLAMNSLNTVPPLTNLINLKKLTLSQYY